MNLTDALSFPIRRGGWIMIVVGAIFSVILDFLQIAPVVGFAVAIFSAGYFGSFYLSIISSTMIGKDEMPDWPSFGNFVDDILSPLLRLIGLTILSFWPVFALAFFWDEDAAWFLPAMILTALSGCFYFPMAALASLAYGNLLGALPHIVLPAIVRSLPGYLLVVVALIGGLALSAVVEELSAGIPYVGWLLAAAVALYSMMFQGRFIGLLYRDKAHKLGWE
jgi:hypothetical protein